jgi:hypothetical protein
MAFSRSVPIRTLAVAAALLLIGPIGAGSSYAGDKDSPQNIHLVVVGSAPADGSKLTKLDAAAFRKLVERPDTKVMTPQSIEASMKAAAALRDANWRSAEELLKSQPHLWKALIASRRPGGAAPISKRRTSEGEISFAQLSGDAIAKDLAEARAIMENPKARVHSYATLLGILRAHAPKAADAQKLLGALATPDDVAGRGVQAIDAAMATAVDLWFRMNPVGVATPALREVPCLEEEGRGLQSDMSASFGTPNPAGLLARSSWPLKGFNTCVRDQGTRGTCSAFAVTAAVESLVAVQTGRHVNLSEQDLYEHQTLQWSPIPLDFYGDGGVPPLSLGAQMLFGYAYPWERDWDYNPSLSRQEDNAHRVYSHSCDGYGGVACSDTNHQAARVCHIVDTSTISDVVNQVCVFLERADNAVRAFFQLPPVSWHCETTRVVVPSSVTVCSYETSIPGSSGIRVRGFELFYVPVFVSPQGGIDTARCLLSAQKPVVLCFQEPPSFSSQVGGYVTFAGPGEAAGGGHCVLATGFVDNARLPSGVAPGAGGGYLIVKNSWGRGWGDQGYAYLPYEWVKTWSTCMVAVTEVSG